MPRLSTFISLLLLLTGSIAIAQETAAPAAAPVTLQQIAADFAARDDVPAVGIMVLMNGEAEVATAGERRLDGEESVTDDDYWHLGSDSKAMTASMVGILVEQGLLSWDSRPADLIELMGQELHPDFAEVTLLDLLQHRSGVAAFTDGNDFTKLPEFAKAGDAAVRLEFSRWLLANPAAGKRGEFIYSNAGYCIVASMAEQASGRSWQELMDTELFAPLGIEARYGWPALEDQDQPWGHLQVLVSVVEHDPDSAYKLGPLIAPAGDISLRLADFAKFLSLHLLESSENPLISAETMAKLHEANGDYACGWIVATDSAGNQFFSHDGSAGTFYCRAVAAPARGSALVIVVNKGASEEIVSEIMDQVLPLIAARQ